MKEYLSYSDYILDKRCKEKKDVLNFIVSESKDCDSVVLMGDNFDHRNNSSEVVRDFVSFVESLGDKDIYILSGNHEKRGNGSTAIDFMREVNKPNWHIITTPVTEVLINNLKVDFVPYMLRSELGSKSEEESTKQIMEFLGGGNILFHHHIVEGHSMGIPNELLKEIVLPEKELLKKYNLVVGGHIHKPEYNNNVVVTGSVFNNQVGEQGKFIWKIDESLNVEQIPLPGRKIYSFIDPSIEDLTKLDKNSIIKVTVTKKEIDLDNFRKVLSKFDAHLLIEQYPNKRTKVHFEEGALDIDTKTLLNIYAKEKGIDISKLIKGFDLIK
jgi:DNA repair exonuclease SbcCD nuclease subunit